MCNVQHYLLSLLLLTSFPAATALPSGGSLDASNNNNGRFLQQAETMDLDGSDDCESAPLLPIRTPSFAVTSSNRNSTPQVLACFAEYRNFVFYEFVASGARYRISTCYPATVFDTSLVVGGTLSCGDVGCSSLYSEEDEDCEMAGAATVEFFSQANVTYTIGVAGRTADSMDNFGLVIQEYVRPNNDMCEGREMVEPSHDLEPTIFGSTQNATPVVLSCEAQESLGVYYSFQGTGARFRVSTCNNSTQLNSSLVVSDGACNEIGCGSLYEMETDEDCDVGLGASMEFRTEEDQEYTIYVTGTSPEEKGDFGLTLMEYLRPSNDVCSKPMEIELDDGKALVSGSTANATITEYDCFAGSYPNVFYTVVGTGEMFHASTCAYQDDSEDKEGDSSGGSASTGPSFNTSIVVNEGICETRPSGCVSTKNSADFGCDETGLAATVSWQTEKDVIYTIAVTGAEPIDKGSFQLLVQAGTSSGATSLGVRKTLGISFLVSAVALRWAMQ